MITLINLSNHASDKWSEAQKKGWDRIIDVPFPNVPPHLDEKELVSGLVTEYANKLGKLASEIGGNEFCLMLQGEFSFCYTLSDILKNFSHQIWWLCIPTTERKVVEKVKEDGSVEKTTVFEFVRWRIL